MKKYIPLRILKAFVNTLTTIAKLLDKLTNARAHY